MAAHTRALSPAANSEDGAGRSWLLFAALIAAAFLIRFSLEPVNTVFYDEAVNATLGREVLAGDFSQNATAWTFGSYLYPLTAGAANAIGGNVGLRLWSAALSVITLLGVFGTTLRLFGLQAALWAGLLFGLAGGSVSLGQMAVYDTLSAPLLALALLCVACAAFANGRASRRYLLASAVLYSLSALSKYIALLYFPALLLGGLALFLARGRPLRPLFTVFAPVVALVLGAYLLLNYEALLFMFTNSGTLLRVESSRLEIARTIAVETGPLLPAVAAGLWFLGRRPAADGAAARRPAALLVALTAAALLAAFAAPLYQIVSSNIQSLWKHLVLTTLFLAPAAGFGIERLVWQARQADRAARALRLAVAALLVVGIGSFVKAGMDRNWGLQHSWPNVTGAVEHLRGLDWNLDLRVLAEQSAVYEYYFDLGPNDRDVWSNTFYMEYGEHRGLEAMLRAIEDRYFTHVILDDYYTPEKNQVLEAALLAHGYTEVYRDPEPQELSTGQVIAIRIYER